VNIPFTNTVDMIRRGDNIYASANNKIYYSSNDGATWEFWAETGIPDVSVTCITEGDSAFYVGTYGKSIWRRPFLPLAEISSHTYQIANNSIYNVPENTTVAQFRSNVTLSYGSSLSVTRDGTPVGQGNEIETIRLGDQIRILAEDHQHKKILTIGQPGSGSDGEDEEEPGTEPEEPEVVTSLSESTNGLNIFPVPAKDHLYVNNPAGIRSCLIYNLHGKKVLEPVLQENHIDISGLSKGFYFLKIRNDANKMVVLKFIKE
jgi:hypothetical protein